VLSIALALFAVVGFHAVLEGRPGSNVMHS
jgi:hypothetical protein